jgi:hypothetical protein
MFVLTNLETWILNRKGKNLNITFWNNILKTYVLPPSPFWPAPPPPLIKGKILALQLRHSPTKPNISGSDWPDISRPKIFANSFGSQGFLRVFRTVIVSEKTLSVFKKLPNYAVTYFLSWKSGKRSMSFAPTIQFELCRQFSTVHMYTQVKLLSCS